MQLTIMTALCIVATCLAKNSTRYGKGKIRAARIALQDNLIYRPNSCRYFADNYSGLGISAYITIFSGTSEQDVRDRYSISIKSATKQGMIRYNKGKFFGLVNPKEEILPEQWYGYAVQIHYWGPLVYEDTQGVYRTPSTIKSCFIDDFASHWASQLCSKFFSRKEEYVTPRSTTTTRKYQAGNEAGVNAAIAIPITTTTIFIILFLAGCCYRNHNSRPAGANERNETELTSVGHGSTTSAAVNEESNTSTDRTTTALLSNRDYITSTSSQTNSAPPYAAENDAPPSYYDVVGRENSAP